MRNVPSGVTRKRFRLPEGSTTTEVSVGSEQIVRLFTNALEWRCLDQIRAPIQELRVADLPDRAAAAGGGR